MSAYHAYASQLQEALELSVSPVAIRFVDPSSRELPPGPETAVPAGCAFWEMGSKFAVATRAHDHRFCSIGIHTHGLAGAPETQPGELQDALAAMRGLDYVRGSEVEAIPVLDGGAQSIVYEPLSHAADTPALVLLFASASQGLVLSEALTRVDGLTPSAMGRPACALVPQVVNTGRSAMSLGCCGARAYLDALTDDIAMWGLPGDRLGDYVAEITTLAKANSVLGQFHRLRRQDIESGAEPSVSETLARLDA